MELYVKILFYFNILRFSWFPNMISSGASILHTSQLQTQQVMTSQLRHM